MPNFTLVSLDFQILIAKNIKEKIPFNKNTKDSLHSTKNFI